jgi:type II secretory pathway component GspD/PulD (secretin)
VRPTISRITGTKRDPHPSLTIPNLVPEIQTREMESLMSVNDGDIAVLGGLMQDEVNNTDDAVPGVSKIPIIGNIFTHRNDTSTKTELVVFLRPTVVRDASIQGDYNSFRASYRATTSSNKRAACSRCPSGTSEASSSESADGRAEEGRGSQASVRGSEVQASAREPAQATPVTVSSEAARAARATFAARTA